MTIRESISQVKSPIKEVHADSKLTNKSVYNKLLTKAMLFIQRESDSLKLAYSTEFYQPIKCLKIEEAPAIDPCCGIKSKAVVYRSASKLPDMYIDVNGPIINSITSIDSSYEVVYSTAAEVRRIAEDTNSKYDKSVYAFIDNGYLYMVNKMFPVKVSAAFITDVSEWNDCSCEEPKPCIRFLDSEWRIPQKILDNVIGAVKQDLLRSYKAIQEDSNINKTPNS